MDRRDDALGLLAPRSGGPELVALAEGTNRMDLLPPSQAELARNDPPPGGGGGPAFEDHAETKIGLDAVIAEEAARDPGSLPSRLVRARRALRPISRRRGRGPHLRHHEALGGIKGRSRRAPRRSSAPRRRGHIQDALPSVLRALVTVDADNRQAATAHAGAADRLPAGSPRRASGRRLSRPSAAADHADGDGGERSARRPWIAAHPPKGG